MTTNLFFDREQSNEIDIPLPFRSGGDTASLHYAKQMSGHLAEVAFVGSDETVAEVVCVNNLAEMTLGYSALVGSLREHGSDLELPAIPEGAGHRDLVLGWAAVYAWEESTIAR